MKRSIPAVAALAAVASLALAACSGGTSGGTPTSQASGGTDTGAAAAPVELTVSGWSLATTPEFKVLADAFHAKHSNVTVTLKEYDASKYNDLITADLGTPEGVASVVGETLARLGGLDVLVHNVGGSSAPAGGLPPWTTRPGSGRSP